MIAAMISIHVYMYRHGMWTTIYSNRQIPVSKLSSNVKAIFSRRSSKEEKKLKVSPTEHNVSLMCDVFPTFSGFIYIDPCNIVSVCVNLCVYCCCRKTRRDDVTE